MKNLIAILILFSALSSHSTEAPSREECLNILEPIGSQLIVESGRLSDSVILEALDAVEKSSIDGKVTISNAAWYLHTAGNIEGQVVALIGQVQENIKAVCDQIDRMREILSR